jgi:hypothetical protein
MPLDMTDNGLFFVTRYHRAIAVLGNQGNCHRLVLLRWGAAPFNENNIALIAVLRKSIRSNGIAFLMERGAKAPLFLSRSAKS